MLKCPKLQSLTWKPCFSIYRAPVTELGLLGAQEVATFTASCEKYVGTESGGMDQAISIMGQQGIAKLVEFNPVRGSDVLCAKT